MRPSPRPVQRALITVLCLVVGVTAMAPIAQADTPIYPTRDPDGDQAARPPDYPLRHDFSMVPGIPGHGEQEPTSCFDVVDRRGEYLCRIVAGVEETGEKRNFFVRREDALEDTDDQSGVHGRFLVGRDGINFEGCRQSRSDDWVCDYASRQPVSRTHYSSSGYVLNVFWAWQKHTRGQAGCALAVSGFWNTGGWRAFIPMLDACLNGPMERPQK